MKLLTVISMTLLTVITCKATEVVDTYDLTMSLKVPRIYDNMKSLGYRKDQRQTIKGQLKIIYKDDAYRPIIVITNLVNRTHKVNGNCITYSVIVDDGNFVFPRFNYIGNNKTGKFKTAKIVFYIDANPSYNVGLDEPDNTLLLLLSGTGISKTKSGVQYVKKISGYATGTLGCGCTAYGHISPTRVVGAYGPTDMVADIATVEGRWSAKFVCRTTK